MSELAFLAAWLLLGCSVAAIFESRYPTRGLTHVTEVVLIVCLWPFIVAAFFGWVAGMLVVAFIKSLLR